MEQLRLPIPDMGVPDRAWEEGWRVEGKRIRSVLRRGGKVCVHCMGGLGRTGTVAAILLVELGLRPEVAIRAVREARPGAIETREQEDYVRSRLPAWRRVDRYRGCLLGGAAGDALGAPAEFMSRSDIAARFGPGGIRGFAPAYGRMGAITDDTQMTLFTAEGLLRAREGAAGLVDAVGRAYLRWLATQETADPAAGAVLDGWLIGHAELFARRAPGDTCLSALRSRRDAPEGGAARNGSKGCGGVMRAAPVGLYFASLPAADEGETLRRAFETGCEIAGLTHGHPSGRYPAGVLAALIAALATGRGLAESLRAAKEPLSGLAGAAETLDALAEAEALAAGGEEPERCLPRLGEGWVGEEALALGLFCSFRADAFEEGVRMAVNIDGDSDSTGSIAGNILGASHGASGIPARWLEELELADVIRDMADDLCFAADWMASDGSSPDRATVEHVRRRYPL